MSSTSAAERAATSGPKTQSDSNPHVATPAPHDPTPVKPMQVAILAKKTAVNSDSSVLRSLCNHFEGRVDQTVISGYLSRHAGQEVKFFEVAVALSEHDIFMSENQHAQSHLEVISEFLTAYPLQSTSTQLWDHIYGPPVGPQEQPLLALSPVPDIVTTTKKKDPQYSSSLAAAIATEKIAMPPPQDRTPSKQLTSDYGEAGYWKHRMNGTVPIEDIDPSPTTQADDTGMLDMEDRERANHEKETSRQKTTKGGKKVRVVTDTEKEEQEDGWSTMSSFATSIASDEGSRRSKRSTPSLYRQQGATKGDW